MSDIDRAVLRYIHNHGPPLMVYSTEGTKEAENTGKEGYWCKVFRMDVAPGVWKMTYNTCVVCIYSACDTNALVN